MNGRVTATAQEFNATTIESLLELVQALQDSSSYLNEVADRIDNDQYVSNTLRSIATDRSQIQENILSFLDPTAHVTNLEGSFLENLRSIWTAFRAGLNAGDPSVVLIESTRAENAIVAKFKDILPEVAGNPINDRLNQYFRTVKLGHDRIRSLRDAYQAG